MKLGIFTMTRNRRFSKAMRRVQKQIDTLKDRLKIIRVAVPRYDNLLLTFVDEDPSYTNVNTKGRNDDIFEVNVGYDYSHDYPPEDDVLVIQLLETVLERILVNNDVFGDKQKELLTIVENWTTESIGA